MGLNAEHQKLFPATSESQAGPVTPQLAEHLRSIHIAKMFGDGDFSRPMFIHDGVSPGTTTMKLMKAAIHYTYDEMPSGGRVRIHAALAAIHDLPKPQSRLKRLLFE